MVALKYRLPFVGVPPNHHAPPSFVGDHSSCACIINDSLLSCGLADNESPDEPVPLENQVLSQFLHYHRFGSKLFVEIVHALAAIKDEEIKSRIVTFIEDVSGLTVARRG